MAEHIIRNRRPTGASGWFLRAVLGGVLCLVLLGAVGKLLGGPKATPVRSSATTSSALPPVPAVPDQSSAAPDPRSESIGPPAATDDAEELFRVVQLVVTHQDAEMGSHLGITRSKEDAKRRAEEALARAKKGESFEQLVLEYSDDPKAVRTKGKLGRFARRHYLVPGFSEAAFALKVGQLSEVVESNLGFHVILRVE